MNRHPYQPVSFAETIGSYCTAFLVALGAAALFGATYIALAPMFATPANGHPVDGKKNAAGEWCCGEGDCVAIAPDRVTQEGASYVVVHGNVASADAAAAIETIPEREALPSPDGQFWRCHRPDGSRRCFFAPPPSI